MRTRSIAAMVGWLLVATACATESAATSPSATVAATTDTPIAAWSTSTTSTSTTSTTSTSTTSTTSTSTTSTTTATTTTSTTSAPTDTTTSTTISPTTTTTANELPAAPAMPTADAAFEALTRGTPAATMTVVRDGRIVLSRASGTTIDGAPAVADSPMVIASVSKLLTASMIARLEQVGAIDVDAPMPWADLAITTDAAWADVTPRALLHHTSGMPVVRSDWFDGGADCASFLPWLVGRAPTATRGRWTYSNGNYCALGLLVEHVTGLPLDQAAQSILFDPLGLTGVHLTTDGQLPTDVRYDPGVERLSRLGGAGAFIASTDDIATVLAALTPADLETLTWPGIITDQYGWGHTGSVDGALSCAWVLEGGRTVVAATTAGRSLATGGDVCDRVVPAVAADLGIALGVPDRSPP